jgi:hypothetical protein
MMIVNAESGRKTKTSAVAYSKVVLRHFGMQVRRIKYAPI